MMTRYRLTYVNGTDEVVQAESVRHQSGAWHFEAYGRTLMIVPLTSVLKLEPLR